MTRLVIAEKPSVARDIARVLKATRKGDGFIEGDGVQVSWCMGHMAELVEPSTYRPEWKRWRAEDLPMVPEQFRLQAVKRSADQYQKLRRLMLDPSTETVINACDAGREGELIFRYVYELARCRRPVERLWLSSMTDRAITDAFRRLRPGADFDALGDAARCRSEADWLVGLNATRALTLFGRRSGAAGELFSVGRVQTPTLAMIVDREATIEAFVPEAFWQVRATFEATEGRFEALYTREDVPEAPRGPRNPDLPDTIERADRLPQRERAEAIVADIDGRTGEVERMEQRQSPRRPPLLFDLTGLQRRANQRYGLSAQATLEAAQSLYEKHKVLTYPRTDSNYLTTDMVATLPDRVRALDTGAWAPFAQHLLAGLPLSVGSRVVNDKEVGDHHAIIPTGKAVDPGRLDANERRVFDLVARRFLAVFYPDAIYARSRIDVRVEGHLFVARGSICVEPGWQVVEPPPPPRGGGGGQGDGESSGEDEDNVALPRVKQGEAAAVVEALIHEGLTQPPRRYNEASLLGAMERAGNDLDEDDLRRAMKESGLGTPATRASIIEVLLKREYIVREGKLLAPTPKGRGLIGALPPTELRSAHLTGRWEAGLSQMANGKVARTAFMAEVEVLTRKLVTDILGNTSAALEDLPRPEAKVLGRCPLCGEPVTEGFKAYVCGGGRACSFVIFKKVARRTVGPKLVQVLLGRGRSQRLEGFRSKAGKPFAAMLVLNAEGKVEFDFGEWAAARPSGPEAEATEAVEAVEARPGTATATKAPGAARSRAKAAVAPPAAGRTEAAVAGVGGADVVKPKRASRAKASGAVSDGVVVEAPAVTAPAVAGPAPVRALGQALAAAPDGPAAVCPVCHEGTVITGHTAWGCSRFRQGCRFVLSFEVSGRPLWPAEAAALVGVGRTGALEGFKDGEGSAVAGRLVFDAAAAGFVRLEAIKAARRKTATR